jgi:hypothetical protein
VVGERFAMNFSDLGLLVSDAFSDLGLLGVGRPWSEKGTPFLCTVQLCRQAVVGERCERASSR